MQNNSLKNIFIIFIALLGITIVATFVVLGFNSLIGFTTDINNEDVATSIAAVAFSIGLLLKLVYEKNNIE